MSRSPNWCFTINNYTEEEYVALRGLVESDVAKYIILGKEVGESGTPHLQGYVQFVRKKRLGGVKRLSGFDRAHLEVARGTYQSNRDYCSKDGIFEEFGEPTKHAGQRNDLIAVKKLIDEGVNELDIAESNFVCWANNYKAFERYRNLKSGNRTEKTIVILLIGDTGTGKTRYVFEQPDDRPLYVWSSSGGNQVWFDGYCGQERVLFDDFDSGQIPYRMMLRLTDRYQMDVPVKGGFVKWNPKKIFITSNRRPSEWYHCDTSHLERRIDSIIKFE